MMVPGGVTYLQRAQYGAQKLAADRHQQMIRDNMMIDKAYLGNMNPAQSRMRAVPLIHKSMVDTYNIRKINDNLPVKAALQMLVDTWIDS